jgi:hypothetical protein
VIAPRAKNLKSVREFLGNWQQIRVLPWW